MSTTSPTPAPTINRRALARTRAVVEARRTLAEAYGTLSVTVWVTGVGTVTVHRDGRLEVAR